MTEQRPKLGLTSIRQTMAAALAGAILGFFIVGGFDLADAFPPVVPWTVPGILVIMAAGGWIYARSLPKRIEDGKVSGIEGVRALIIGKSMVMTGAVLAGGHAVYVGRYIRHMEAAQPAQRVYLGVATILAALLLALAGFALEKACIVKVDDDDNGEGGAEPTPNTA